MIKFFGYTYLSDTNKIIWYRKVLDYSDRFDLIRLKQHNDERTTTMDDSLPDASAAPHPDSILRLASAVHRFSIVSLL